MGLYLGQHFSDPQGLLKSMLINDVYLSGSRALDYFVPGSAEEKSDWDFYVGDNSDSIFRFMEFMKSICVKWLTAIEWFTERLENDGFESGITANQILGLQQVVHSTGLNNHISSAIHRLSEFETDTDIEEIEEQIIQVTNSKGKSKVFRLRHDIYAEFDIIHGRLTSHGHSQRIQLMVGTKGLETIMEFYTSAVQCVITGFCAAHMYAADAYNRQSRLWSGRLNHPTAVKKMNDSQKKYERRGFTFYKSLLPAVAFSYQLDVVVKRQLKDPDSHVIDYNIHGNTSRGLFDFTHENRQLIALTSAKRREFYEFSWIQNGRGLMVSTYYAESRHNAKYSAVSEFIDEIIRTYPEGDRGTLTNRILKSTLTSMPFGSSYERIGNAEQQVLEGEPNMPEQYLDQFMALSL
jgi:hypothetical protein